MSAVFWLWARVGSRKPGRGDGQSCGCRVTVPGRVGRAGRVGLVLGSLILLAGCAWVPGESQRPVGRQDSSRVVWHPARQPELRGSELLGVPKLNPAWWLQNADSPPEPWWQPGQPQRQRERSWAWRNPGHNFTHYVVGVSDRDFVRYGLAAGEVWHPRGPLNVALIRCGPLLWLPWVSWRGVWLEGYAGWRSGGNFGLALRRSKAAWRWDGPQRRQERQQSKGQRSS